MIPQQPPTAEPLTAGAACMRLLARVQREMRLESLGPREALAAVGAHVLQHARVRLHVLLEQRGLRELLVALAAREH